MTFAPQISVVTPTRNRREALLRAIASVRAQTSADFEHIVVDDCSTDGTAEAVAAMADRRLVYLPLSTWSGANLARNRGIAAARAPIVAFLDSDDEYLPHRLETTLRTFALHRDLRLVISSFNTVKRGRVHESRNPGGLVPREALERALAAQALFVAGSAITARRDALAEIDGFDPDIKRLQDQDLLLRLARHSGAFLSSEIDWVKHASADSISSRPVGFVEAYGELAARHAGVLRSQPDLARYMVARRIMMSLGRGRLLRAGGEFMANRRLPVLRFGAAELVSGYVNGKRLRMRIRRELAAGLEPPTPSLKPHPSPLLSGR